MSGSHQQASEKENVPAAIIWERIFVYNAKPLVNAVDCRTQTSQQIVLDFAALRTENI